MEHDDFANVSWQIDPAGKGLGTPITSPRDAQDGGNPNKKRRGSGDEPQAGRNADALDLAGVGEGTLECTVGSPIKENDGTKDAFMSYLVTTNVCPLATLCALLTFWLDYISFFPKTYYFSPETLHRFRFLMEDAQ